jgi:hypothetical protein
VKQRLSRGRKLLQEQFLAFVAGALKQTSPGKTFTLGVIAALPLLATTAKAATVGTALAQHGSVAAKTTSLGGFLLYAVAPLSLVIWVWQRRRPIAPETAGGAQISSPGGRSITLWVVLAMTGALVCLAFFFLIASASSQMHLPETQFLSTAEVQNLIANPNGRDIEVCLTQLRNGFRRLNGAVRENGTPDSTLPAYWFAAPAENSTLALLTEKGIRYETFALRTSSPPPIQTRSDCWLAKASLTRPAWRAWIGGTGTQAY